jgi:SAM-dependent methyltransferase
MTKKVDFDHFVEDYDKVITDQLWLFDQESEYFAEYKVRKARELVPGEPSEILDYGCGIGRSIPFLKKYFQSSRIFGCDTSEKSVEYAKERYPFARLTTVRELEKSPARFDLVFVAGVYHHIPPVERQGSMAFIRERTRRDSDVIIFEHNPINPVTRYIVHTCPFDKDAVLLRPRELEQLCKAAGLQVVSTAYTLFFPALLKGLRPLERYLAKVPLGGQYLVHARNV